MTIREVESATGLVRANVRFYEKEGLISPARGGNGCRDYSPEDVESLMRIKLLRSIGIPIGQIKELIYGRIPLSLVLSQRLEDNGEQFTSLGASDSVCRSLLSNRENFEGLDPRPYLSRLTDDPSAAVPKEDAAEPPSYIRRFFARYFDQFVYSLIWGIFSFFVLHSSFKEQGILADYLISLIPLAIMLFAEPLFLCRFGTTLGKWLLGIKVHNPGGGHLSYVQGLRRTGLVIIFGLGLNIPFYDIIRLWRCRNAVLDGEDLPWEKEGAYESLTDGSTKRKVFYGLAAGALLFAEFLLVFRMMLPINRGSLTQSQFVENFNYMSAYNETLKDEPFGYTLLANGTWQKSSSGSGGLHISSLITSLIAGSIAPDYYLSDDSSDMSTVPLPQLSFTHDSSGHLTGLSLSCQYTSMEDADASNISSAIQICVLAFLGAQPDLGLFPTELWSIIVDSDLTDLRSFAFSKAGVSVDCHMAWQGYTTYNGRLYYASEPENSPAYFHASLDIVKQ